MIARRGLGVVALGLLVVGLGGCGGADEEPAEPVRRVLVFTMPGVTTKWSPPATVASGCSAWRSAAVCVWSPGRPVTFSMTAAEVANRSAPA